MNFDALADAAKQVRIFPGLPAVPSVAQARKAPRIGSTATDLDATAGLLDVANAQSVKVRKLPNGGVAIEVRRNIRFPGLIDDHDADGLRRLAADFVDQMKGYSRGPLNARELRRRGHPYGRGLQPSGAKRGTIRGIGRVKGMRGSVPDLSIINTNGGEFERAWESSVEVDATGATLTITNSTPYAFYLAAGTGKMKAHGPFTQVPIRNLARINSEWQKIVRAVYSRKRMEADMMAQLGISD